MLCIYFVFTKFYDASTSKANSSNGRLFIYQRSIELGNESFLFGHGFGSFDREYNLYQEKYFTTHRNSQEILFADDLLIAPSDFLQTYIELGLIGVLLLLLVIIAVLRRAFNNLIRLKDRKYTFHLGATGSLLCLITCSLFSYPLQLISVEIFAIFIFSFLDTIPDYKQEIIPNKMAYGITNVFLFILIILWGVKQFKYYNALRNWRGSDISINPFNENILTKTYNNYRGALGGNPSFLRESALYFYLNGSYQAAIALYHRVNSMETNYTSYLYLSLCYQHICEYQNAHTNFIIASNIAPNRFLPKYYFFLFLLENKKYTEALHLREEINDMKIKFPSTVIEELKNEINRAKLEQF